MTDPDLIVVGSGFAGAITAERMATQRGKRVLVVEKRDHIAGNMYDYPGDHGVLVHKYGPHLFRTNSERVVDYLSQFTQWQTYQHRVLAEVDNRLVPVPFNLTSLELLRPQDGRELSTLLVAEFGMHTKVPVSRLRNHSDARLRELGDFIFQKIYLNYTVKQWGQKPEDLDFETITARVPVHVSYDARYFTEWWQALPAEGYTRMFERMLADPGITVELSSDARSRLAVDPDAGTVSWDGRRFDGDVVWTGPIDELFGFCYGDLPYRSLKFELASYDSHFFQPVGTVNYPNEHAYTRITEFKHFQPPRHDRGTVVSFEYPQEFDRNDPEKDVPYYPIPSEPTQAAYDRYRELADGVPRLRLLGRLAEYRYYDMSNIVQRALEFFEEWVGGSDR